MANGWTHFKGNITVAAITLPVSVATFNPQLILGTLFSNLISIPYGPDSDLEQYTHGENRLQKIPFVGVILKIFIGIITLPYATIIGHRSEYSHMPVLSDFIRYLYIEFWVFIFDLIFNYNAPTIFNGIFDMVSISNGQSVINWINWVISPFFISYIVVAIIQTSVHTLLLDGGKITKKVKGKNKNVYLLGKQHYNRCKKIFG